MRFNKKIHTYPDYLNYHPVKKYKDYIFNMLDEFNIASILNGRAMHSIADRVYTVMDYVQYENTIGTNVYKP